MIFVFDGSSASFFRPNLGLNLNDLNDDVSDNFNDNPKLDLDHYYFSG